MEAISIKEISLIEVKIHKDSLDKDERRYAYEKAIEAYWKHVDRYHTWMNYYAIFNGALFVGFCTLLTATSDIDLWKEGKCADIVLSNNYVFLQSLMCFLGIITSICWLCSLLGHATWMSNWMRIIEEYEDLKVYKLLLPSPSEFNIDENNILLPHRCFSNGNYRAISTTSITKIFVSFIIGGWVLGFIYILWENFSKIGITIFIGILIA